MKLCISFPNIYFDKIQTSQINRFYDLNQPPTPSPPLLQPICGKRWLHGSAGICRAGGWRGWAEVAAVPQSQTFLCGARARGSQTPPLIPFDTDIVKIGVRQSWDCRDAMVSLLLLATPSPLDVE